MSQANRTTKLNKDAKLLLVSQSASFMGDYCVLPAILILATYYGNYWVVSGVLVVRSIPMIFQPFLGVFVDKFERKVIMFWTDIIRGLCFLALFFLPEGEFPLLFLGLLFVSYASGVFFNPARLSLMANLGVDVKRINTLFALATTLCIIFGASFGALFLFLMGSVKAAVLFNALSYLLPAALVLMIKAESPKIDSVGFRAHMQSFKRGLLEIKGNAYVRNAVYLMMTMATMCGVAYSFYPSVSEGFIDGEVGNFILTVALGVGGFIGAKSVERWGFQSQVGITLFYILSLASILCFIYSPTFMFAMLAATVFYMAMEFGEVIAKVRVHESTTNDIQGRIFAVSEALIGLCLSLGALFINLFSLPVIAGIIGLMIIALAVQSRSLRHMTDKEQHSGSAPGV
ncbi:MFS transporter [Caldalkalibacillus salinus]|uniref:MFS transporter n=1 Tax=Caldalkalibacillus salinus TaxID=2803787 RepID=UPI001921D430|nr:MFS transporter [Caldalkalibacillus salinus]